MKDTHEPFADSPFAEVHIGSVVTRFGEHALRIHHARFGDPPPAWFSPDTNKAHGAAHLGGFSVYWQSEYNEATRTAAHPFETDVVANAVHQLRLI